MNDNNSSDLSPQIRSVDIPRPSVEANFGIKETMLPGRSSDVSRGDLKKGFSPPRILGITPRDEKQIKDELSGISQQQTTDRRLRDPERPILKTGSYDRVSLVDKTATNTDRPNQPWYKKLLGRGQSHGTTSVNNIMQDVLWNGKVALEDLHALPSGDTSKDQLVLASMLPVIGVKYHEAKLTIERERGESVPHDLGLHMSDMLEVMPVEVASRVLLAATSSDNARSIMNGEGPFRLGQAADSQQYAVEAVVLLPSVKRRELFMEMAKLSPGEKGGAYRFFAFIASHWTQQMGNYNGQKLIEKNLPPIRTSRKIREVASDISELGDVLRASK